MTTLKSVTEMVAAFIVAGLTMAMVVWFLYGLALYLLGGEVHLSSASGPQSWHLSPQALVWLLGSTVLASLAVGCRRPNRLRSSAAAMAAYAVAIGPALVWVLLTS